MGASGAGLPAAMPQPSSLTNESANFMKQPRFLSRFLIYKGVECGSCNFIYDEDAPEYDCFIPVSSGRFHVTDCWICNEHGEIHPGYAVAGVPVNCDDIGEPIADNSALTDAE